MMGLFSNPANHFLTIIIREGDVDLESVQIARYCTFQIAMKNLEITLSLLNFFAEMLKKNSLCIIAFNDFFQ